MSKLNNWLIKTTIFGKIAKRIFVDEYKNYYNNGKEYGNGCSDGCGNEDGKVYGCGCGDGASDTTGFGCGYNDKIEYKDSLIYSGAGDGDGQGALNGSIN